MTIEGKQFSIAWPEEEVYMLPGSRMQNILWYEVTDPKQIVDQTVRINGADYIVTLLGMQVGAGESGSEVKLHQEPNETEIVFPIVGFGTMIVSETANTAGAEVHSLIGELTYEELAEASFELKVVKKQIGRDEEQIVLIAHVGDRAVPFQPVTTPKGSWHQTLITSAQDDTSLCWMCVKLTPQ